MFNWFNKKQGKPGLVGINYSGQVLSLAHVVPGDEPVLNQCEEHVVESESELLHVLSKLVQELGLEGARATYVLSPNDYQLLLVEAPPNVEGEELNAAIKWKIRDLVDQPVEELAVTVFPVPDDAYRGDQAMVYAVASSKGRIQKIVDLIAEAGLRLEFIDIPELVYKNLTEIYADDSNGLAFLDLRGSGSVMNICKQDALYLTRHLNTKLDQDIVSSNDWHTTKERLSLEVQRSLDYYESQMGQVTIPRILIAPRKQDSREVAEQLNTELAVNVEYMNLAEKLASHVELSLGVQHTCLLAIGGALRQDKAA